MLVFQHTYTLTMLRTHQALILIAVMLWQALSWVTPFVVQEQSQRLAHLVIHEEVIDHHHHHDESIHLCSRRPKTDPLNAGVPLQN
jgi:hypothetical protein